MKLQAFIRQVVEHSYFACASCGVLTKLADLTIDLKGKKDLCDHCVRVKQQ